MKLEKKLPVAKQSLRKAKSSALRLATITLIAISAVGCASGPSATGKASMAQPMAVGYSQAQLPESVRVPAGHRVMMEAVGVGEITYQCRVKANMAGQYEWVFVGPNAKLNNRKGLQIGKYFGPPATWESSDGSKLTGTQVAVAPTSAGNIPLQLVKANPAMGLSATGEGNMKGVTYIQRVETKGGVAPSTNCGASNIDAKQIVSYQSDYIFYSN